MEIEAGKITTDWDTAVVSSPPKPNLFLIGAMKSGTSSLHVHLGDHPAVFMCDPKEPSYFLEREQLRLWYPAMEERGFWRGEDRYLALFRGAGAATVIGESSTSYTKLPQIDGVVDRIARFNPEARFIYLMRDPVERTISHYWHMVLNHNERRPMLEALQVEPHYTDVSNYARQLSPYLERFGRGRILTLTTETMQRDPVGLLRSIFQWLGVDPGFVSPSLGRAEHVTPDTMLQARGWRGFHRLRETPFYRAVRPLVPQGLRTLATRLTRRRVARMEADLEPVRRYLRPIQSEQAAQLQALLGREFPEWTSLWETV